MKLSAGKLFWGVVAAACLLGVLVSGGDSRPINPPLAAMDRSIGYRTEGRAVRSADGQTMIVLAFSGGGTRAAAFSFGVLEELRRTVVRSGDRPVTLLDQVDIVTGVSGGSFTALAYALHGERLFAEYEQRFLKRDVQGELLARFLSPKYWRSLWSGNWGRSELAADYYDEILFEGATFGDLIGRDGPLAIASATDLSTGSRLAFVQGDWDLICSDLSKVSLSRAAASSSAVPLLLSPVTLNNYGGTCGYRLPGWTRVVADPDKRARPAGRAAQRLQEMLAFQDGHNRPFLHLVDGGLADNLGMRTVLESLETVEASRAAGRSTRLDSLRRIVVFVVNSLSVPKTDWDRREQPPSSLQILLKATGVPIDRYSYESVETLRDLVARWNLLRKLRSLAAKGGAHDEDLTRATSVPDIELYAIDVSFAANPDHAERAYLNGLPTSFVLPSEAVDRLRQAAGVAVRTSPEFQRLLQDLRVEAARNGAPP